MSLPVTVPFTFGNATTTQSLSSLDTNFTTITNSVNGLTNGASQINVASISATGAANNSTFLRGDGAWATVTGGGTDATYANLTVTQNLIPPSSFLRNRIINGNMTIDQRNGGAQITAANLVSSAYMVDRWIYLSSQAAKFTAQQNAGAVTTAVGFPNYLGMTVASAFSVGASDYSLINQLIEGFNFADFGFGTASAKTVTLSFVVYSSLTGTFGGSIRNSGNTRSYPFTYSIPTANTWTTISVTIAGDTSGTWIGATNGVGVQVGFGLGAGTTYSGTAGAWASANYVTATGAVSVVGTASATFYITGVQLEVGTVATPFERRQYGQELALCQRYYEKSYNNSVAVPTAVTAGTGQLFVNAIASGATVNTVNFAVSKRASPTVVSYDNAGTSGKNSYYTTGWNNGGTATINTALEKGFNLTLGGTGTLVYFNADWAASAEL